MKRLEDVSVHIPAEHLADFAKVVEAGLQRAKLSQEARKALASWWEAEYDFIIEEQAE